MPKIYLLTSYFPFQENSEAFLIPEIASQADHIDEMEIFSINSYGKTTYQQPVPEGTKASCLFEALPSGLFKTESFFRVLFRKEIRAEIKDLRAQGRLSRQRLKYLLAYAARGMCIFRRLEQCADLKKDSIIYSYWMIQSAYAAALAAEKYGIKAVSRAHGYDLYDERNNGYQPLRKFMLEKLTAVYPVSQKGVTYLTERYGYADKVMCRHLGTVNPDGVHMLESRKPFRIVSCAYLVAVKRIPLLAKAVALLKDQPIEWVHFGDGPEMEQIQKIVKDAGISGICQLKGNVPSEAIMTYYRQNDVSLLVNVSASEGIPVSIMEAMSFGIPVMATNVGGTGEIVHHGRNGILLSEDITAEELAEQIRAFMNMDPDSYAVYRKNAHQTWNEQFSAVHNFTSFYEELRQL